MLDTKLNCFPRCEHLFGCVCFQQNSTLWQQKSEIYFIQTLSLKLKCTKPAYIIWNFKSFLEMTASFHFILKLSILWLIRHIKKVGCSLRLWWAEEGLFPIPANSIIAYFNSYEDLKQHVSPRFTPDKNSRLNRVWLI